MSIQALRYCGTASGSSGRCRLRFELVSSVLFLAAALDLASSVWADASRPHDSPSYAVPRDRSLGVSKSTSFHSSFSSTSWLFTHLLLTLRPFGRASSPTARLSAEIFEWPSTRPRQTFPGPTPAPSVDFEDFASRQQAFLRQHGVDTRDTRLRSRPWWPLPSARRGIVVAASYLAWTASLSCCSCSGCRSSSRPVCWPIGSPPGVPRGSRVPRIFVVLPRGRTNFHGGSLRLLRGVRLVSRRYDFCAGLVLAMSSYEPPCLLASFSCFFLHATGASSRVRSGCVGLARGDPPERGAPTFGYYVYQASRYRYGQHSWPARVFQSTRAWGCSPPSKAFVS